MNINKHPAGFTLIELIVVLVIIGVLAVSLVPRFFSGSGTAEYLYQDQALNLMRKAQMQAMQCTSSACRNLASCQAPVLLIVAKIMGTNPTSCTDNPDTIYVSDSDNVSFSFSAGINLSFNSLGQPVMADANQTRICTASACRMTIQGINTLQICVQSEGYIHPCG